MGTEHGCKMLGELGTGIVIDGSASRPVGILRAQMSTVYMRMLSDLFAVCPRCPVPRQLCLNQ